VFFFTPKIHPLIRETHRDLLNDFRMNSAGGETRTHDLGIMRPSLYP
jgi:hypothetical protein